MNPFTSVDDFPAIKETPIPTMVSLGLGWSIFVSVDGRISLIYENGEMKTGVDIGSSDMANPQQLLKIVNICRSGGMTDLPPQ